MFLYSEAYMIKSIYKITSSKSESRLQSLRVVLEIRETNGMTEKWNFGFSKAAV